MYQKEMCTLRIVLSFDQNMILQLVFTAVLLSMLIGAFIWSLHAAPPHDDREFITVIVLVVVAVFLIMYFCANYV